MQTLENANPVSVSQSVVQPEQQASKVSVSINREHQRILNKSIRIIIKFYKNSNLKPYQFSSVVHPEQQASKVSVSFNREKSMDTWQIYKNENPGKCKPYINQSVSCSSWTASKQGECIGQSWKLMNS